MMLFNNIDQDELMLNCDAQKVEYRKRNKNYIQRKVSKKEFSGELEDGWEVLAELKTSINLKKLKPLDEQFEDRIWLMFHRMGVELLSSGRNFEIQYGKQEHDTQQVDVLVVDQGVAFYVECKKASSKAKTKSNFKTDIEALAAKKSGIRSALRAIYGRDLLVGFIFATEGYQLSEPDNERLNDAKIAHFAEAEIKYYEMLANQLGTASRFQLFADIFPEREINDLDNRVYALEGKMGGHKYYTFNIEPEKLLRISYVLHRSKVQSETPSYQRVIKRARLKSVQSFVDEGGYFPNSLIINLTNTKKLKFEALGNAIGEASNRAGVLHLPKQLRSAYIIDGQHRLYGYSDSRYANNNSIPVVAFVDLPRDEQLRIFVDINENQKAVAKNLRSSLEEDLYHESDIAEERLRAIKSGLIRRLGEDVTSPLNDRILLGEDPRTETRVISIESVKIGLNRSGIFPKFKRNKLEQEGIFGDYDLSKSANKALAIMLKAFLKLQEEVPNEWNRLQSEKGLITVPNGINALISIIGDLLLFLRDKNKISPLRDSVDQIILELNPYLDVVAKFYAGMDVDLREKLASEKGGGAPRIFQNHIRASIRSEFSEFEPEGLDDFIKQQDTKFNDETSRMTRELEANFRDRIRSILAAEKGRDRWMLDALPAALYNELLQRHTQERREENSEADEKDEWDYSGFAHHRTVIEHNWKSLEKEFMEPQLGQANKSAKTSWLKELNNVRKKVAHGHSNVSEDEYELVHAIFEWHMKDNSTKLISLRNES